MFQLQSILFPTDRSTVAYVITLLAGREREWGTALWADDSPVCCDFKDFGAELDLVLESKVMRNWS